MNVITKKTVNKKNALLATQAVTTIALLTTLSIICSMFLTIRGGAIMKFSPVFIIVALAARRYGIIGASLVAFMSDFIQFLMFPSGSFSIGISVSGVLSGVIFGIMFYKKINLKRIIIASVSSQIICSLFITTFTMVYIERWYESLFPLLYFRMLQTAIMIVANIAFLYLLFVKTDLAKITKIIK